ncbi:STAS domain-containing protein [Rickettsiella endosymbiont of Miltochrista miniata]|uniref:STAS domain-containing protein n=1 Tax=Rickettsiella endosymbiont of Miltochrista miniata TaxID=3066239 RepID=UPI00313F2D4B
MNKPSLQFKKDHYVLSGSLNTYTVPGLWELSQDILKKDKALILTFNLEYVTQSDSSGVALLIAWMRLLKQRDQKIRFVALPIQMLAIIRVSDLEKILPINRS